MGTLHDEGRDGSSETNNRKRKRSQSDNESPLNGNTLEDTSQPKKIKKKKKEKKTPPVQEDVISSEKEVSGSDKEKKNKTKKLISNVLDYLHQWKKEEKSWKFNKYYQACLINYLKNPSIINKEDFETSLQYLKKCRGSAKERIKIKANAWIKEAEGSANGIKTEVDNDAEGEKGQESKSKSEDKKKVKKRKYDGCTLFVKNLPYGQTVDQIRNSLQELFPTASDIRMPFSKRSKSITFAFVEFSKRSEVDSAISTQQGVNIGGRPLFLDRDGNKEESYQRKIHDSDTSLSSEFENAEKIRRANQVLQMFS